MNRGTRSISFRILLVAWMVAVALPAAADGTLGMDRHLVVIEQDETYDFISPADGFYDFGEAYSLGGNVVEHTFVLRNAGAAPLTISRLVSPCGCTTATLVRAGQDLQLPYEVGPDQSVAVRLSLNPSFVKAGGFQMQIELYAVGQNDPCATLELSGTVESGVTLDPPSVDFGTVASGTRADVTLKVVANSFAPISGHHVEVVPSDGSLSVTEVAGASSLSPRTTVSTQTFDISLVAKNRLGPYNAWLYAQAPYRPGQQSSATVRIPVHADVTGIISAEPSSVDFGNVSLGSVKQLTVNLISESDTVLTGMGAFAPPPLYTSIAPTMETAGARRKVSLIVTLNARFPGTLTSDILVKCQDGTLLVIPVTCNVLQ